MSKLDKNFKDSVNKIFRECDYVHRKLFLRIVIVVIILSFLGTIGGFISKKIRVERDRAVFKNSTTYTEAAAAFLADRYMEYNDAETDAEKRTIMQYVIMRYPNLDVNDIENQMLKQFYNKCLLGG